jgi:hypothetical protein
MLKIYTNTNLLTQPLIKSINSKFQDTFYNSDLDNKDVSFINIIDKATVLDATLGTIQTPFGITSVSDLSGGTKTLIVANHIETPTATIDLDNCGDNALTVFLNTFIDSDIECIITHLGYIEVQPNNTGKKLILNNQTINLTDFNKALEIEMEREYNDDL